MSESYPHIAGSCPANTTLPPLQPRTTIIMHTKRSPVQRAKRASHGEAGCGGDAASRCGNEGQGKRGCRRAGQRIGRKGPREQTYSRRYTQNLIIRWKDICRQTHKTSRVARRVMESYKSSLSAELRCQTFGDEGISIQHALARESSNTRQINTKRITSWFGVY